MGTFQNIKKGLRVVLCVSLIGERKERMDQSVDVTVDVTVTDPQALLKDVQTFDDMLSLLRTQRGWKEQKDDFVSLRSARKTHGAEKFDQVLLKTVRYATNEEWSCRVKIMVKNTSQSFSPECALWILANSFFCNVKQHTGCGLLDWTNVMCTLEPVGEERLLCFLDYLENAESHLDRPNICFERIAFDEWDFDPEVRLSTAHVHVHDDRMEKHSGNGNAFV